MVNIPSKDHVAEYQIRDGAEVSRAFRQLNEFVRGRTLQDAEEFIWMVPQDYRGKVEPRPVAIVQVFGTKLRVECPNQHTLRAMQILVECIAEKQVATHQRRSFQGSER